MSGIDEQILTIPFCPVCNQEPDYWIGYFERGQRCWLLSESYYGKNSFRRRVMFNSTDFRPLDEIVRFRCYKIHYGKGGHITNSIIYLSIIRTMEELRRREGVCSINGEIYE